MVGCPFRRKGRAHTECGSPIWIDGEVDGKRVRESLETRDWQRAIRGGDINARFRHYRFGALSGHLRRSLKPPSSRGSIASFTCRDTLGRRTEKRAFWGVKWSNAGSRVTRR